MGASLGGVAFKLDPAAIDSAKVIQDLFGPGFQPYAGYGDIRYPDYVFIGKTHDLLIILSMEFTDQFFGSTDNTAIQSYLDYFGNPSFVFAFEEYDSGGSYGYTLIYDGQVKRQYRLISGDERIDFGEPEPEELRWLNLPTETIREEEETSVVYVDAQNNNRYYKEQLPAILVSELMKAKLGFTSWDLHEKLTAQQTFKRERPAPAAKKPWWKLW